MDTRLMDKADLQKMNRPDLETAFLRLQEEKVLEERKAGQRIHELEQAAAERNGYYREVQNIRAQHHMAEEIQRGMLPDNAEEISRQIPAVELFADMDTAWEVGGDFYDYRLVDDHHLMFCIGDVSGKGVPAAMLCQVVKTVIDLQTAGSLELAEICEKMSAWLYHSQKEASRMFVTLWIGILDVQSGELDYVNAGQDAPLLFHADGSGGWLEERSGLPLSSYRSRKHPERMQYQQKRLEMKRGDVLLLYTDGMTDSENPEGERFGRDRLFACGKEFATGGEPVCELVHFLERRVGAFADRGERDDDITLLALRYKG